MSDDQRWGRPPSSDAVMSTATPALELCDVGFDRDGRTILAGIDLRIDGHSAVCFEVNASPGYSYYEESTGQPISRSLAAHLASSS